MRVSDLLYVAGIGLSTANQSEDYEPHQNQWGGEDNCLGKKWVIAFHKGKYIFGRPTNYCLSTDMVRIAH